MGKLNPSESSAMSVEIEKLQQISITMETVAQEMSRLRQLRHDDANTFNSVILATKTAEMEIIHLKELMGNIHSSLKDISTILNGGPDPEKGFVHMVLELKRWMKSMKLINQTVLTALVIAIIGGFVAIGFAHFSNVPIKP